MFLKVLKSKLRRATVTEAKQLKPKIVVLDEDNRIRDVDQR
jgi:aspartate 1-decarboxylase